MDGVWLRWGLGEGGGRSGGRRPKQASTLDLRQDALRRRHFSFPGQWPSHVASWLRRSSAQSPRGPQAPCLGVRPLRPAPPCHQVLLCHGPWKNPIGTLLSIRHLPPSHCHSPSPTPPLGPERGLSMMQISLFLLCFQTLQPRYRPSSCTAGHSPDSPAGLLSTCDRSQVQGCLPHASTPSRRCSRFLLGPNQCWVPRARARWCSLLQTLSRQCLEAAIGRSCQAELPWPPRHDGNNLDSQEEGIDQTTKNMCVVRFSRSGHLGAFKNYSLF